MKTHDLSVITGEYEDRKTGQMKKKYQNVGAIVEKEGKPRIYLDKTFNPAGIKGDGPCVIFMFGVKANKEDYAQAKESIKDIEPPSAGASMEDDIPFTRHNNFIGGY